MRSTWGEGVRRLPDLSHEENEAKKSSSDTASTEEALQISSGATIEEIERKSIEAEAGRTEKFRDHFELISLITLWVVWFILVIAGLLWVYHLLAPPDWFHLPDEQVEKLHGVVTGGALAGFATGHMKKRLGA